MESVEENICTYERGDKGGCKKIPKNKLDNYVHLVHEKGDQVNTVETRSAQRD